MTYNLNQWHDAVINWVSNTDWNNKEGAMKIFWLDGDVVLDKANTTTSYRTTRNNKIVYTPQYD